MAKWNQMTDEEKKQQAASKKEQIDKCFSDIEENIPKVFEDLSNYLDVMSRFHTYSLNNQILILSQNPDARLVAGYTAWQKNFGRQVNKGEKGLTILAPTRYKKVVEEDKLDENGDPVLDKDGNPVKEQKEQEFYGFKAVKVFDVSQTTGKELPSFISQMAGTSEEAKNLLQAAEAVCDIPIYYKTPAEDSLLASAAGYFRRDDNTITINSLLPDNQKAKTLIHEMAHGKYHLQDNDKPKDQKEIEAEATAYAVCKYFGLDTSDYSFKYIASWSQEKDPKELKAILNDIRVGTSEIISSLEEAYTAIKDKNKMVENEVEEPKHEPEEQRESEENAEASKKVEEKPEPVVEEPAPKESEPAKPAQTIEDFGNKIGGARKDLWAARGMNVEDLIPMNEAEKLALIKKDNVWKKPNYQELVDSGIPREVVYFYKIVRDACATKPTYSYADKTPEKIQQKQSDYVDFVSKLRDAVLDCKTIDDIKNMSHWMEDNGYVKYVTSYCVEVNENAKAAYSNKLLNTLSLPKRNLPSFKRDMNQKQFCFSEEEKKLAGYVFLPYTPEIMKQVEMSSQKALELNNGYGKLYVYPRSDDIDLNDLQPGKVMIIRANDIVSINHESVQQAKDFVLSSLEDTTKQETERKKRKTAIKPPMLEGVERSGPDYRSDKDVSGQDYLDTFGFNGGEFGNWLNDNERQQSLNFGFDAFKDLAKVLGVDDKAITFNGSLSIAFGARGRGAALAHYEPLREVINLTKMKGAGALGHEWIHALDHSLGKQLGFTGLLSEKGLYKAPESFKNLMNAIKRRTYSIEETKEKLSEIYDKKIDKMIRDLKVICRSPSSPEQKAKQEELIQAFVDETKALKDYHNVTLGSRMKMVRDSEPSPAYKALLDFQQKELEDKNPGRKQNIEYVNSLRCSIRMSREALEAEEIKPMTADSNYYSDATKIDGGYSKSGHGYWASNCELLARAGAVYLLDKCKEMGIRDDYLNGLSEYAPVPVGDGELAYTYPRGEERKAINAAFDKFFEEVKELGLFGNKTLPSLSDKLETADSKAASVNPIKTEKSKENIEL